jgi:hypothetical protein
VPPGDAGALARVLGEVLAASPAQRRALVEEGRGLMASSTADDPAAALEAAIREVSGTAAR